MEDYNNDDYYLEFTDKNGNVKYLTPDEYVSFTSPANLYGDTSPEELYEAWKEFNGCVGHLESALEAFQKDEMYEHCVQIKRLIDEKLTTLAHRSKI